MQAAPLMCFEGSYEGFHEGLRVLMEARIDVCKLFARAEAEARAIAKAKGKAFS